jgi:hypothetical protein
MNIYLSNLDSSDNLCSLSTTQKYPKYVQILKFTTQNVVWEFSFQDIQVLWSSVFMPRAIYYSCVDEGQRCKVVAQVTELANSCFTVPVREGIGHPIQIKQYIEKIQQ